MRTMLLITFGCLSGIALAAEPIVQFRTPLHIQNGSTVMWLVVPDWNTPQPKTLLVFGRLWRHADKEARVRQWAEVMGGGLLNRQGGVDPILNLRAGRADPRSDFYAELFYNVTAERMALVFSAQRTIWRKVRLGVELESAFGKDQPDLGIGPKVTVPFRCGSWKCSISSVYFIKRRTDVLRTYTPITAADW